MKSLPQEINDIILIQSKNIKLARKLKNDYVVNEIIKNSFTNIVQNKPELVKKLIVSSILKNNWLLTTTGKKIAAVDGIDVGDETGSLENEEWYVKNNKSIIFSFPNLECFEARDKAFHFKIDFKKSPKLKYIESTNYTSEMRHVNKIVYNSFNDLGYPRLMARVLPTHNVEQRDGKYIFTKRN